MSHLPSPRCALTEVVIRQHRKAEFTDESALSRERQVCLNFACRNYVEPKLPESEHKYRSHLNEIFALGVGKGASLVQAFGSLGWNRIRPCHQQAGSFKEPIVHISSIFRPEANPLAPCPLECHWGSCQGWR